MRKIVLPLLVLAVAALAGWLLMSGQEEPAGRQQEKQPENGRSAGKQEPVIGQVTRQQVVRYLQDSTLETNYGGQVFADYHMFGKKDDRLFVWAYVAEFYKMDGVLKMGSARSGPMMINVYPQSGVADYWTPKDGAGYAPSIKSNFPPEYHDKVLNFQSRHKDILEELRASVQASARKAIMPDGRNRVLSVGETVTISLGANQTTGFSWHYTIEDTDIVEVVDSEYQASESGKNALGAPGARVYTLNGLKAGVTTIKFEYYRDWEPEKVEKTREFKIRVNSSQANFEIPGGMVTRYISFHDRKTRSFGEDENFPEYVRVANGQVECAPAIATGTDPGIKEKEIDGRQYCVRKTSEGAAGKIYREYDYATLKQERLVLVSFTVSYDQCDNYSEPERSECETKKEKFSPDAVAKSAVASMDF